MVIYMVLILEVLNAGNFTTSNLYSLIEAIIHAARKNSVAIFDISS